jgi:hypothetical protein
MAKAAVRPVICAIKRSMLWRTATPKKAIFFSLICVSLLFCTSMMLVFNQLHVHSSKPFDDELIAQHAAGIVKKSSAGNDDRIRSSSPCIPGGHRYGQMGVYERLRRFV